MSNDIHSVLSAINEASGALQREPEYKTRIGDLEHSLSSAQQHSQRLELRIVDYKNEVDALQSKVRSLEVERDDAGFRELEAQDKLDALRLRVKAFMADVEVVMPKPVEIKSSTDMIASAASESEHRVESVERPTTSPSTSEGSSLEASGSLSQPETSKASDNSTTMNEGLRDPFPTFTVPLTDATQPIASMPSASMEGSVGKPHEG